METTIGTTSDIGMQEVMRPDGRTAPIELRTNINLRKQTNDEKSNQKHDRKDSFQRAATVLPALLLITAGMSSCSETKM